MARSEEGVPYFVMDYADGQPIDIWCDEHKADVTRRLELFRAVCSGVQHAHDHLVLHRDLKPANIFVTADGGVKLLDFGIAKLLARDAVFGTYSHTVTAMRVMTPRYASPEQVRGEPLSVTSDVYALGVVLYELLTGHWPYRAQGRLLHEVTRAICEEEPTVPSTVIEQMDAAPADTTTMPPMTPETISAVREGAPATLRRRLKGDLDTILLKALAKDPLRRYWSVEQFSEDVRRHLEGMPVAAREDSFWYRASKFIRRHPVGIAAAILITIAQQLSYMTTVWELRIKAGGRSRRRCQAGTGFNDVSRVGALRGCRLHQPSTTVACRELCRRRRDLLALRDGHPYLDALATVRADGALE